MPDVELMRDIYRKTISMIHTSLYANGSQLCGLMVTCLSRPLNFLHLLEAGIVPRQRGFSGLPFLRSHN